VIDIIPSSHLVQTALPNTQFAFELAVDDIDSSAVYLRPTEPTFCLNKPIAIGSTMSMRFYTRAPNGAGFVACAIPPTRILVSRTAAPGGGPTTFTIRDGTYIGALAQPGALYSVPVIFQRATVEPAAMTALETALVNAIGAQTSNFTGASTFTIAQDTSAIPLVPATDDIYIFVPKNGVSFSLRFSCLQSTRTNDLVPTHS
jgi:hypothetical protein